MSNTRNKITDQEKESQIFKVRHSLSHVLAQSVMHLYPDVKLGIGPAIEDGFYYDFLFENPIPEEDLEKIEAEMREVLKKKYQFTKSTMPKEQALEFLFKNNQPFKAELADEKGGEEVSFYTDGDFTDLCKGPHVNNTGEINTEAFKLTSIAGAYWKGDEKRPMMQRIYGVAFETKEELDKYFELLEEAKKRDHRKLGKQLDLFVISELVGSGLPLFTPKGAFLRDNLAGFSEELQKKAGFEKVWIPHITKTDLYKVSGHWDKYGSELFLVQSQETSDQFVLKPMNCPHHNQIYASQPRSYKDLPIRYYETTTNYRDEKAGEMLGLSRVRSLTQDDAHVYCRMDQIEREYENIMQMINELYRGLGLNFKSNLSFRDPNQKEKYLGDDADWAEAQRIIEHLAKKLKLDYKVAEGDAAFYGPKIDFMVIDALGREWQCGTIQLDFQQPKRFNLTYVDKDGQEKTPVMIHKALLGSIERFMSVYIEHTGGNFPLWLCYTQAVVIPISADKHGNYGTKVVEELKAAGIRAEIDNDAETLGNKIRKAQMQKLPYMLIIGDKELETGTVAVRQRSGANLGMMKVEEIKERLMNEINNKS